MTYCLRKWTILLLSTWGGPQSWWFFFFFFCQIKSGPSISNLLKSTPLDRSPYVTILYYLIDLIKLNHHHISVYANLSMFYILVVLMNLFQLYGMNLTWWFYCYECCSNGGFFVFLFLFLFFLIYFIINHQFLRLIQLVSKPITNLNRNYNFRL